MSVLDKYLPTVSLESETSALRPSPETALFNTLDTISLEAINTGNMSNYFQRKLKHFGINIVEGFNYLTTWNYDPMEALSIRGIRGIVDTLDYMEMGDIIVGQPMGFKGELLPYTVKLLNRTEVMHRVITEVIKPTTVRFAHYLTNPMERSETRGFVFGNTLGYDVDKLVKEDIEHFSSNRQATVKFNKLFSSLGEFVACEENLHEVALSVKNGGTADIKSHVKNMIETTNALMENIAKDKTNVTSKEFTLMFSKELTAAAKWVEWYAIQMTRIIETNNVLYANELILRKL